MTEPSPPTFEVGKRAYWIHEQVDSFYGCPPVSFYFVHDGVVMSTGPAVTQVWDDNGNDPLKHHAVTFANDKIWPEPDRPKQIASNLYKEDIARRQAAKSNNS